MNKVIFNLIDDIFSHDKYSVAGRDSKYIDWDRSLSNIDRPTFYSHNRIPDIDKNLTNKENSYGILFESKSIIPTTYREIEKYIPKFNKVFTHNSEFIKKYDNCYWIPGGGVWIGGSYGKGEIKLFEKTKICSIVSSNKQMCDLHKFRSNIAKNVKNLGVDVFGLDSWVTINKSLEEYMFSIIIENYQDDLYFTEKILNCFATGTIPIYLGAKNIAEKFNINGIIAFSNFEELNNILINLTKDFYYDRMEFILDNFERCITYKTIEDYIYLKYML